MGFARDAAHCSPKLTVLKNLCSCSNLLAPEGNTRFGGITSSRRRLYFKGSVLYQPFCKKLIYKLWNSKLINYIPTFYVFINRNCVYLFSLYPGSYNKRELLKDTGFEL